MTRGLAQAREFLDLIFNDDGPGVAVGTFSKGFLLSSYCRGLVDLETRSPINVDTAFHVASVSKQFTAYAIAQLASEHKLRLEDTAGRYLAFLPAAAAGITISQLLFHTNGLNDQWVLLNLVGWSDRDIVNTMDINRLVEKQSTLKGQPGEAFSYTNTGYTLLAEIVQAVVGQSLDEYLQAILFEPLGMARSRFRSDFSTRLAFEAECYAKGNHSVFFKTTPQFATVGATSLQTSLRDLALWERQLSDSTRQSSQLMRKQGTLTNGTPTPYGFGLYHGAIGNAVTLTHSGWDVDFTSYFVYLPECGVGAAVMSNGTRMNLELIALSALCDHVELGDETAHISKRLATSIKSLTSKPKASSHHSRRRVYGSLASGDVRIWEQDVKGQRLNNGAIQCAAMLDDGTYMLVASLFDLHFAENAVVVSSPTQNTNQTLTLMPSFTFPPVLDGKASYFSLELNVTHTLIGKDGLLFWIKPGGGAYQLEQVGPALFFSEGFTLAPSDNILTIFNARSAPIIFERL